MTITGWDREIKGFLGRIPKDVLLMLAILLTATGSFGLGYLAGKDGATVSGSDIWIEKRAQKELPAAAIASVEAPKEPSSEPMAAGGGYVASKSGKAYHLPWCPGAARIKEENKIWFASKEEAEAKGYTAAKNCKGI